MIRVKKLEKGTYFDDAYMLSFRYDPSTVAKVKEEIFTRGESMGDP